jgi:hypothetical protein
MKRLFLLVALIWVPFVSIFGFASPAVADVVGDSHPHMAFHIFSLALLTGAFMLARRELREASTRTQRVLLWVISVTVPVAIVGNVVELVAAVRRFADDGWRSLRTPEVFEGPGLHAYGANLTIPGLLISMLAVLALLVAAALQGGRRMESVGGR